MKPPIMTSSFIHEAARADVQQLCIGVSIEIVNLHHTDPGPIVYTSDNDGIKAGRQRAHESRFGVVRRGDTRRADLRCLRLWRLSAVLDFPIIIRTERSIAIKQLEGRVRQRISQLG